MDAILHVVGMALDWLFSVAKEMLAESVFEIPDAFAADLPEIKFTRRLGNDLIEKVIVLWSLW